MLSFVTNLYVFVLLFAALVVIFFTPKHITYRAMFYYGVFILSLNLITLRVLM
jgi:hypothetical protein